MNFELFENINYSNIEKLFTLSEENPNNLRSVKIQYSRNNKYFQESLNFLINIKFFTIRKNSIEIQQDSKNNLEKKILSLVEKNDSYSICLKNYLSNFLKDETGTISFKPEGFYKYETSSIRDFLISLKYIRHEIAEDKYILLNENILTKFSKREHSPEWLKRELLDKEMLGLAAEKIIVNYEENRIKQFGNNLKVDHVALRDVSAGYDIQSFEGNEKIFIEVKAVSLSNYKFHLSASEYQTAINLKDKYYVYLLPVDHSKPEKFDTENLVRINNIKDNIFSNKSLWEINNDGYIVYKK